MGSIDQGPIGPLPGAALDLSNIMPTNPVDFNGQRIINVGNPIGAQDVVTLDYFNSNPPAGAADIDLSNILPVADVDFNLQKLVNVDDPTNPQDVVTLNYYNSNPPAGAANIDLGNILPIADVDFNLQKLINVADPTNVQDVVTLNYFNTNPGGGANTALSNLIGVSINANLTHQGGGGLWDISTPHNAGGASTGIRIFAGGAGNSVNPGTITIITGDTQATTSTDTASIAIRTGSVVSGAGTNADSGVINIFTGQINNGGETGDSGAINIFTGQNLSTSADDSGLVSITTGDSNNGSTGTITIESGTGPVASGDITIITGVSAGTRGSISLTGLNTTLTAISQVSFTGTSINYNSTPNIDHVWQSGTTGTRPAGVLGKTYFDTTLGIPIWFDGTNWVDATGASV